MIVITPEKAARPVARMTTPENLDLLGGRLELVASVEPPAGDAVMFRARMEAGSTVPLHSHSDPECFHVMTGSIEAFVDDGDGWRTLTAGESITMEDGVRHAVRAGIDGADMMVLTNHRLTAFFREARRPSDRSQTAPSEEDIARVAQAAARYGYWLATPEEHSRITGEE